MNTKHTEGKIHVGMKPGPILYGAKGEAVADCNLLTNFKEENIANAERLALAWNLLPELPALLPDPAKLRIIASHFDLKDLITGDTQSEVQDDLRQWARNIESILAKATNPNAGVVQAHPKGRW